MGRDYLVLKLCAIFLGMTLIVAGALAGIVLLVLGGSKGKPRWQAWGVVLTLIFFGLMIAAITWAMRTDATL